MAAGDITVGATIATIECDDTARQIMIDSAGGSLCNIGSYPVYVSQAKGDLARDGNQSETEIELGPNDSIPLPRDASFVRHQCAVGQTTKMWFIPNAG